MTSSDEPLRAGTLGASRTLRLTGTFPAGVMPFSHTMCQAITQCLAHGARGHETALNRPLLETLSRAAPTLRHARQARGGARRRAARATRRARARHGRAAAGRPGRAGRRAHRRPACQPRPGVRAVPGVSSSLLMRFPGSLRTCGRRVVVHAASPTPVRAGPIGGLSRSARPDRVQDPASMACHALFLLQCRCTVRACTRGEFAVSLTSSSAQHA
jgi:hypothetical protein